MRTQPERALARGALTTAGFTLVEIMVVIVILGILATIVTTNVLGESEKARITATEVEVKSIHDIVKSYMIQNPGPVPGWDELLAKDQRGHQFIEAEAPKQDPWNNEYVIEPDPDYPNKPMVRSWGPDGQPDTEDDITNQTITAAKSK